MKIVARPWEPQDLIDDIQDLIDEEPDLYLNTRRTTLCTALAYLKEFFGLDPQVLTIEELSQMHGEPVWVSECKEWAIVEVDTVGKWTGKPFANGMHFDYDIEKRKLHCYRHRPKEEKPNE